MTGATHLVGQQQPQQPAPLGQARGTVIHFRRGQRVQQLCRRRQPTQPASGCCLCTCGGLPRASVSRPGAARSRARLGALRGERAAAFILLGPRPIARPRLLARPLPAARAALDRLRHPALAPRLLRARRTLLGVSKVGPIQASCRDGCVLGAALGAPVGALLLLAAGRACAGGAGSSPRCPAVLSAGLLAGRLEPRGGAHSWLACGRARPPCLGGLRLTEGRCARCFALHNGSGACWLRRLQKPSSISLRKCVHRQPPTVPWGSSSARK